MKRAIIALLLMSTPAFAVCDYERDLRDKSRNLCLSLCTASGVCVKVGMSINPWLGLTGLIPGAFAQNQCRIWVEREEQLSGCMSGYAAQQAAELQRQRDALERAKQRQARIDQINVDYDGRVNTANDTHRAAVRQYMMGLAQQGRNLRDPQVQAEIREHVRGLETNLNAELTRINEERQREINAV